MRVTAAKNLSSPWLAQDRFEKFVNSSLDLGPSWFVLVWSIIRWFWDWFSSARSVFWRLDSCAYQWLTSLQDPQWLNSSLWLVCRVWCVHFFICYTTMRDQMCHSSCFLGTWGEGIFSAWAQLGLLMSWFEINVDFLI